MSTIDLGNIKFNWKGTKDTSTAYAIDDVVYVDPHSYVCVQAHTNQAVNTNGNNAYWEIIASGANLPGQTGNAGKFLQSDGTNLSWQAAESTGRFLGIDLLAPWDSYSGDTAVSLAINTSGATGTWTRPSGCNSVFVYVTGGGGGAHNQDSSYRGGSGGAGGTAIKFIENVASSVSYTVGTGGSSSTNTNGSNRGGTSSFGSYCSAYGGWQGRDHAPSYSGGHGGGATGGDLNIPGGGGAFSHSTGVETQGGASFWTQSGSTHHPTGTWNVGVAHGRWGSGGGLGHYSHSDRAKYNGGSGVIVIYKYS